MARMESRYHNAYSVLRDLTIISAGIALFMLVLFGVSTGTVAVAITSISAVVLVRLVYRHEAQWLRHHIAGVEAYGCGDTDRAERHFRQSADYARSFPKTDNRLGQSLSNLAAVSEVRGQFDEAAKLYAEALATYERSSGPGVNRAPSVKASLERLAEAASQRNAGGCTAPVARSRTETIIDVAARVPEVQRLLRELAELQDQLLYSEPSTFPLMARSFQLSTLVLNACGLAASSSEGIAKLAEWVNESAVELDYYARAKHRESEYARAAATGCATPVGSVFLSWTIKSPRERAAMEGVKLVLDYFNLTYFDYTKCRADESNDESAAISVRLIEAIDSASCSVELMSAEFGGTEWIQFERNLLRENGHLTRIILCLDAGGAQFIRASDEHRTVRIDVSDGRPMAHRTGDQSWMKAASNPEYYRTSAYMRKALGLGKALRRCHEAGDLSSLQTHLVEAAPNDREFDAFAAWIPR